ncbi:hypothetical protein Ahy_B09g098672 [Arachis hypogaea]|uniref:Pentatricopeptide repeat-containing protein n=1 Tax=Arachis hypogaea TaxID=3818 RepID=A0A444XRU4_ARAHY|nr:hypothetical protein Ahy_B09g098672 [Arachis hypogaea]
MCQPLFTFPLSNPPCPCSQNQFPIIPLRLHHPSAAYALKAMFLSDALKLFKEMPQWNVVCFNAVLSGLSQNRPPGVALRVHCLAVKLGVEFDVYVAISLVNAYSNCGDVSAVEVFKEMPLKIILVTALVDMYSKCGCWRAPFNVFNAAEGNNRNLITWNSMISGMMPNAV